MIRDVEKPPFVKDESKFETGESFHRASSCWNYKNCLSKAINQFRKPLHHQ